MKPITYLRQHHGRGQARLTAGITRLLLILGVLLALPLSAQTAIKLSDGAGTFASSQFQAAAFAVDGDSATRWESNHGIDPAFLTLDLGQAFNLSQVIIRWEAANAATYTIQGSNNNSSWTTLATRTGGAFGERTDTVAVSGNYRYVRMNGTARSAGNDWGYSIWEMEVYGASNSTLPAPWNNGDVGSPLPGSASLSNGVFNTTASGNDIWSTADNFHFVYQPLNGDGMITARVNALAPVNAWAKAGVMVRENLTANAKNAYTAITSANGATFQRRATADDITVSTRQDGITVPYWVRLVRSGNTLTGYISSNGSTWTQLGSDTVTMATTVYIGLAQTSHDAALTGTAQFSNVTVQTGSLWSNTDVGTPLPGGVNYAGSSFITSASGDDIWNNTDNFHFVYQPFNGDGAIIAQVTSLDPTNAWAKAGVMFRENLTGGSKNAMMAMTSSNGAIFQRRTTVGGTSTSASQGNVFTPYWVKLTRNGNTLTGFSSTDGTTWTQIGSDNVSMATSGYVGLAHTSHAAGVVGTAQFDNVTLQAGAVCFYENTNFGGASFCRGAEAQNVPAGWTNRVSSVRVINGYTATLRSQANQAGSSVTLTSDTANLASVGFDNLMASYAVTRQGGNTSMKIVGYMPSWAGSATAIQYSKLTHINYSFVLPNANGTLQGLPNPSKLQSIVTLGHANGVKVLIAVGGWNGGNDSAFESLAANASTRTAFVNNLMNLVEQYNLDGVDMDWEYPDPGASADNYALLMGQLSNALRARGKLLTAAVVASGFYGGGLKAEVFNYVDFLNLMAYDGGDGADHSPYSYAVSSLNYWLGRGLPKEKAVLGVPYYARPSWAAYNTLVGSNSANICRDTNGSDYWNGIPTIRQKAQLARSQAGGIMTWELSQDTNTASSLLTAMYEAVNGLPGTYNCN
jgi:GH18 family chitinase